MIAAKLSRQNESGVALITALLMVAFATILVTAMVSQLHLDIRRAGNLFHRDQALLYNHALEGWIGRMLIKDVKDNNTDHLGEAWAEQYPPLPVTGGFVVGQLSDQQGLFNLNNLVFDDPNAPIYRPFFQRLLTELKLPIELADAVKDWIDNDQDVTLPDGAEDDYYLGLQPAYRTADQTMLHISELRLVKGIDAETYAKLLPFVTVLPQKTTLNVNTASQTLLQSLSATLDSSGAQTLVQQREFTPFDSKATFLADPTVQPANVAADLVTVSSNYFLLVGDAMIGDKQSRMKTIYKRTSAGTTPASAQAINHFLGGY